MGPKDEARVSGGLGQVRASARANRAGMHAIGKRMCTQLMSCAGTAFRRFAVADRLRTVRLQKTCSFATEHWRGSLRLHDRRGGDSACPPTFGNPLGVTRGSRWNDLWREPLRGSGRRPLQHNLWMPYKGFPPEAGRTGFVYRCLPPPITQMQIPKQRLGLCSGAADMYVLCSEVCRSFLCMRCCASAGAEETEHINGKNCDGLGGCCTGAGGNSTPRRDGHAYARRCCAELFCTNGGAVF
jgi:hypothetical protein